MKLSFDRNLLLSGSSLPLLSVCDKYGDQCFDMLLFVSVSKNTVKPANVKLKSNCFTGFLFTLSQRLLLNIRIVGIKDLHMRIYNICIVFLTNKRSNFHITLQVDRDVLIYPDCTFTATR